MRLEAGRQGGRGEAGSRRLLSSSLDKTIWNSRPLKSPARAMGARLCWASWGMSSTTLLKTVEGMTTEHRRISGMWDNMLVKQELRWSLDLSADLTMGPWHCHVRWVFKPRITSWGVFMTIAVTTTPRGVHGVSTSVCFDCYIWAGANSISNSFNWDENALFFGCLHRK